METEEGFWRKLFGLDKPKQGFAAVTHPGHSMTGKVVTGQPVDWSRYDCAAELVLEPDNPYDKFAVKVMVDGRHVGYLPKGIAKRVGKRLRALEG